MSSLREQILHAARNQPYDPAARRERYLRERKLLGRRKAGSVPPHPVATDGGRAPAAPANSAAPRPASTPVTPERVAALKVRLEALRELLSQLVEQAKAEAGIESTTPKKDTKKTAEPAKPDKPKTAAEKKDEAKKAKERRDKAPPKPETVSSVQAQIDSVRKQIEGMRAQIAAARKAAPDKKPEPDPKFVKGDKNQPSTKPSTANEGRQH